MLRARARRRVQYHRQDGEGADREAEPVGIDPRHDQAVVDHADEQGADDEADDRADATGERRAADDGRRDRLQLETLAQGRQRGAQTEGRDHAGESATSEQSMKQNSFTRRVSIPMSSAACRWPPVA